uniref:Uncharacterized protein n=2 Tax=viral metagenome TaxID=1070528 RepID=A0A6M3LQJ7_9ZZZZ
MKTGIKQVYKVVRIDGEELKSVWAGNPTGGIVISADGVVYKEGEITYAPKGQQGLSTFDTLLEAIAFASTQAMKYSRVVHEATPLGKRGEKVGSAYSWGNTAATYPAILLGKEVWKEEEKKPEPKFKIGDRVYFDGIEEVLTIKSFDWLGDHYAYRFNENCNFNSEWLLSPAPKPEPKFKVGDKVRIKDDWVGRKNRFGGTHETWNGKVSKIGIDCNGTFYVELTGYRWVMNEEEAIELVPVEEWVDVTKECTYSNSSGYVCVRHGSYERILLGSKGMTLWCVLGGNAPSAKNGSGQFDNYKVEVGTTEHFCGKFKILKKQIK